MGQIRREIKIALTDILDDIKGCSSRRNEIKKFQDNRREKIYRTVDLSKEQSHQIDSLYQDNYGKKIPDT